MKLLLVLCAVAVICVAAEEAVKVPVDDAAKNAPKDVVKDVVKDAEEEVDEDAGDDLAVADTSSPGRSKISRKKFINQKI